MYKEKMIMSISLRPRQQVKIHVLAQHFRIVLYYGVHFNSLFSPKAAPVVQSRPPAAGGSAPKNFCPSCGTKAAGGRFCSSCGTPL